MGAGCANYQIGLEKHITSAVKYSHSIPLLLDIG